MKKLFLYEVINNFKELISKNNIKIEYAKNEELNFENSAEQVDLLSCDYLMRITLFDNSRMYIHVINISTEETLYFFDDYINDKLSAENLIIDAIKMMIF